MDNIIRRLLMSGMTYDQIKTVLLNKYGMTSYEIEYDAFVPQNYQSIDDIMETTPLIIFIRNPNGGVGHWVCMFKKGNYIEYFDSYGEKPLKNICGFLYNHQINRKKEDIIEYNHHELQNEITHVCGYMCIMRIIHKNLDLNAFIKVLKKYKKHIPNNDILSVAFSI